ncbi:MAG: ABC transporter substrate-binding protein [Chloroflexi bacterium]|nr:ABC transporter substrate-binding protein [Chloroflexota bacterium]
MLKTTRWLVLLAVLLVGCGSPAPTPTTPPGSTAASPAAGQPTTVAAPPSPLPSPTPSPSPTPIPPTAIKIATVASLGAWPIEVADKQGFFRAQNLVLDRSTDPKLDVAAEVAKSGRDLGVATTDDLIRSGRGGQALVMIGGTVNRAPYSLVAARDVPGFAELKGKIVGTAGPKDVSTALLLRILRAKGLSPNDVEQTEFSDPNVREAAVMNGTAGASILEPPQSSRLLANGFSSLAEASDIVPQFQAEGIVVRPDWARQHEDTVVRFLRAVIQAERWITTPANRDGATALLATTLGISGDEAKVVYERFVVKMPAIPPDGDVDVLGVRAVIDLLADVAPDEVAASSGQATAPAASPLPVASPPPLASPGAVRSPVASPTTRPTVPSPSPIAPPPARPGQVDPTRLTDTTYLQRARASSGR